MKLVPFWLLILVFCGITSWYDFSHHAAGAGTLSIVLLLVTGFLVTFLSLRNDSPEKKQKRRRR